MTEFCQSCGMPLTSDKLIGTEKDGSKSKDYCIYCFKYGSFTKDETMEEMIESCVPIVVNEGIYPDADTAHAKMMDFFPKLKRWNNLH